MNKSKLSKYYRNGTKCAFYKHRHPNRKIMATRCSMSIDILSCRVLNISSIGKYTRKYKNKMI